MATEKEILRINGHEVTVTNPRKVYFPETGHTKLDLVQYYLAVADGALRGAGGRPMALKRFVDGAAGQPFFQKRAPGERARRSSGPRRSRSRPGGPPTRSSSTTRPGSPGSPTSAASTSTRTRSGPRTSTTPTSCASTSTRCRASAWSQIRDVALAARESLEAVGLVGWPKTSGSRGIHINVRIEPRWTYPEVRRAALALARDVERRVPDLATSKWWKEERHGVFLDYNQNAKDRTVASAYSVRPLPDARVSTPLTWDEVPTVEAEAFTIDTVPARFAAIGDPGAGIDEAVGSLEGLLELSARDEAEGLGDAPVAAELRQAGRRAAARPAVTCPPARSPSTSPGAARRAARRPRSPPSARPPSPPATRMPACRPSGSAPSRRRPGAARRRSRSSRSPGPSSRTARWRASSAGRPATPTSSTYLEPADVLVDGMRGRSAVWYRVRVNLIHVPEEMRPAPGAARIRLRPVGRHGHRGVEGGDRRIARTTPRPRSRRRRRPPEPRTRDRDGSALIAIDHVQLGMPAGGEDRARAFYAASLGLREVPKPPELAGRGGVWFAGEPESRSTSACGDRHGRQTGVRTTGVSSARTSATRASHGDGRVDYRARSATSDDPGRSRSSSARFPADDPDAPRGRSRRSWRPDRCRQAGSPLSVERQPGAPVAATTARVRRSVRSASS